MVAFDYALNSNMLEECGGYQYGTMTFASIDEMLFMVQVVLKKLVALVFCQKELSIK